MLEMHLLEEEVQLAGDREDLAEVLDVKVDMDKGTSSQELEAQIRGKQDSQITKLQHKESTVGLVAQVPANLQVLLQLIKDRKRELLSAMLKIIL
jgi:hypothetical protein